MASTEELVITAQHGEKSAFAELIRLHERAAIIAAYAILYDYHAAQDVVQDSFLSAFSKLSQLRNPGAFGAWFQQIVRRQALLAKKTTRYEAISAEIVDPSTAKTPDWLEPYEDVVQQLEKLPEKDYSLVILRYINGLSVKEIAATTGEPTETVRKQIYRAINRLRTQFEEVTT